MLLMLAQWLSQDVRGFGVINYITLRTVLAAMTALLISFAAGPRVIRWLAAKKIGQAVRQRLGVEAADPSGTDEAEAKLMGHLRAPVVTRTF